MEEKKREAKWSGRQISQSVQAYRLMDDEQLLDVIRKMTEELGRLPNRSDVPGDYYFRNKFGPWPRVLEAAGVKPVSEVKLRRDEARRKKHIEQHIRRKMKSKAKRAEQNARSSQQSDTDANAGR